MSHRLHHHRLRQIDDGEERGLEIKISVDDVNLIVTRADLKTYAEIEFTDHDALLDDMIVSSQQTLEAELGITLLSKTYIANWTAVTRDLFLPRPPITSITTVKEVEIDGTLTTLAEDSDYEIKGGDKKYIAFSFLRVLPIEVTYVAGFANAAAVPLRIHNAIKKMTLNTYMNRENYSKGDLTFIPNNAMSDIEDLREMVF